MTLLRAACAALLVGLGGSSRADDSQRLLAFAKSNAGRFGTEVPLPAPMRVRVEADLSIMLLAKYEPTRQRLVQEFAPSVDRLTVTTVCKTEGSYQGRTALGVTRQVTRRSCSQLGLEDPSGGVVLGEPGCASKSEAEPAAAGCHDGAPRMEVSMSPDQYRDMKRRGLWLDVTFEPGAGAEQEVATQVTVISTPKLDWPYEDRISRWIAVGRVSEVRLVLKDGVTQLAAFHRPKDSGENPPK